MLVPVGPLGDPRRAALLPGSFDPLHLGHVALAQAARGAGAELVVLLYAVRTMPKDPSASPPLLPEELRLDVVGRFVAGHPGLALAVASHGLLADQAEAASELLPGAELSFAVGSDKVLQVFDRSWYPDPREALDRLFSRAVLRYALREGEEDAVRRVLDDPANGPWADRVERLEIAPEPARISSRLVREGVRRGRDVSGLVPPETLAALV